MWGVAFYGWPVEPVDFWRVPGIRGSVAPLRHDLVYIRSLQKQADRSRGDHFDAWTTELAPSPCKKQRG